MEKKADLLRAQFGSLVVPAAHAIPLTVNFSGVSFNFTGRVTNLLDADESVFTLTHDFSIGDPVAGWLVCDDNRGDRNLDPAHWAFPRAQNLTLTVGSAFAESLPFAESSPGFEIVVANESGGHAISFESDFSLVTSPIFSTNVQAATVVSLADSTRSVFANYAAPSMITLSDFDETQCLIVFYDTLSTSLSFLEVKLQHFTADGISRSNISEPLGGPAMHIPPADGTAPDRRLTNRRHQSDRRGTLRWDPHGGDRRYRSGRRKEDKWDTMKVALSRLF
ncbi:MAG: hypothetical protein ACE5K1_03650 [Acidiferrobacterales bacterium]